MTWRWSIPGLIVAVLLSTLWGCAFFPAEMPSRYAIVYGVSEYDDTSVFLGSVNLEYPAKDAEDVAAALKADGYNVILQIDEKATKTQLATDINEVASRADKDSVFLFYFSGHGYGSGKEEEYEDSLVAKLLGDLPGNEPSGGGIDEYLFLYGSLAKRINTEGNGTVLEVDPERAVTDDELATMIARIPALGKIVIADMCHAGGIIGDTHHTDLTPRTDQRELTFPQRVRQPIQQFRTKLGNADITDSRTLVLAASGEREFAWEPRPAVSQGDVENGYFTHYLLEGARRGDRNGDGYVTALELYRYTTEAIVRHVNPNLGNDRYRPQTNGGALDFVVFGK